MKISKIIILIVITFLFGNGFTQDYLRYNYYLHRCHQGCDPQTRLIYYDSAFNCVHGMGFIDNYVSALASSMVINDFSKAKIYYLGALKQGGTEYYIKNEWWEKEKYKLFKASQEYKQARKEYNAHKKEWKIKKNHKLCCQLRRIIWRDQFPRIFRYSREKIIKKDSINVAKIKNIYQNMGRLPNVRDIGKLNSLRFDVLFLHLDPEEACFFANIYLNMYLKGEYDDLDFIFMILDQASWRHGTDFGFDNEQFFIKNQTPRIMNKRGYHKQSFGFMDFTIRDEEGNWHKYIDPVYDQDYTDSIRLFFGYRKLSETSKYFIYDEQLFIEKWGEFMEREFNFQSKKKKK